MALTSSSRQRPSISPPARSQLVEEAEIQASGAQLDREGVKIQTKESG
jgi:hypothetical protein